MLIYVQSEDIYESLKFYCSSNRTVFITSRERVLYLM